MGLVTHSRLRARALYTCELVIRYSRPLRPPPPHIGGPLHAGTGVVAVAVPSRIYGRSGKHIYRGIVTGIVLVNLEEPELNTSRYYMIYCRGKEIETIKVVSEGSSDLGAGIYKNIFSISFPLKFNHY